MRDRDFPADKGLVVSRLDWQNFRVHQSINQRCNMAVTDFDDIRDPVQKSHGQQDMRCFVSKRIESYTVYRLYRYRIRREIG